MEFNNDIVSFITDKIGIFDKFKKLAGDASTREYYRLYTKNKNYLLCYDSNINKIPIKNYPQFILYRIFKDSGLKIPEIFYINNVLNIFILEDLGDKLLYNYYFEIDEEKKVRIYKQTIDALINVHKINGKGSIPFKLFFNIEKLMFEFDFFIEHALLNYYKFDLSENDKKKLHNEFLKISDLLNRKEYFVLNHRDFHSRNIIIKNSTPHIIDYQDARMGLPQYDLVSLLRDSYIQLDSPVMDDLKYYYYGLSKDEGIGRRSITKNLHGKQRHGKG